MALLGLISDTHGLLDYRVPLAFEGVSRILHAGDIGAAHVIWELETIAPVTAVFGNVDLRGDPDLDYPSVARFTLEGVRFLLVHDSHDTGPVSAEEADAVVFGHSHMPLVQDVDGVRWVNPGSASQYRRSPLGRSVALMEVAGGKITRTELVALDRFGPKRPAGS